MAALVAPTDLADFPGAPFAASLVAAASEQVRRQCGWHIAPLVTETFVVDSDGGRVLLLPTMRLVTVTEVRNIAGSTPEVLTGWRKSPAGMLFRASGWPAGFQTVEVDMQHGYEACPDELLPIIAERCQVFAKDGSVRQESLGSRSVSYGLAEGSASAEVLARFMLPGSP
jgi:hypothetical protein